MVVDNLELCIEHFKSLGIPEYNDDKDTRNMYFVIKVHRRNKDFRTEDNPFPKKDWHIRTFRFHSIESLIEQWDDIKLLCKTFKARAYFSVCIKNKFSILVKVIQRLASYIDKYELGNIWTTYESEEAQNFLVKKLFVVDIDGEPIDSGVVQEIKEIINKQCRPLDGNAEKVMSVIPTVSGTHLICTPFASDTLDIECISKRIKVPEIQVNSMSLLYFNDEA